MWLKICYRKTSTMRGSQAVHVLISHIHMKSDMATTVVSQRPDTQMRHRFLS